MKRLLFFGLLIFSFCFMQACNSKRAHNFNYKTKLDDQGFSFVKQANEAGKTEIAAATLAKKNSQNSRVINYAKMMITDHTAVGNELKKVANEKAVILTDSIKQEHQTALNALSAKLGADFDKAYMQMMIADHEKVIEMFHDAGENTSVILKNFTDRNLGKLQMHLDSAKAINASLK